jgi:predicted phosphodiesterase
MDEQHEVISRLKAMAVEQGRTPTRDECEMQIRGYRRIITKFFNGSHSIMLQAAGLDTYNDRRAPGSARAKRIDNSIFERDIERHLEEYEPRAYSPPAYGPTLAVISDIHWPFQCDRVIAAFLAYVEEQKPDYVVINGDAWDMYSHSKYPRSHNVFTPRDEERMARERNEAFWAEVRKRSPGSKCYQLMGNHDVRPLKRVLEVYPEAEDWIKEKLTKLFSFDGVTTFMDPRQELYIDDKTFVFHGNRTQLGAHRDFTLMNCHIGHTHKGGVVFKQLRTEVIYEANSGVAGDPESKGLTYTAQKINDMTPGFGARDKYGPRFIPA